MPARPILAALAVLVAAPALAQGSAEAGAGAYDAACGRCHSDPVALMGPTGLLGTANGAADLDAFLATHRRAAPDAATRADIVAYLMSLH